MSKTAVMLKRDWPGSFRRSVFKTTVDKAGKKTEEFLRQLVFEPGIPVELDAEDFKAVQEDINKSLIEVQVDEQGIARVVMSDKEREELLLANAEAGRELDEITKKCVDLQKQVETLQATVQEQAATITKQSEEITSLEDEVLELEEKLSGKEEEPAEPGTLEALGLASDIVEILKRQGIDSEAKLRAFGESHAGSYLDLDDIGKGRNDKIVEALQPQK